MREPAPGPNKQQERTERSSNALLEAASELIVEGGLDSLTFAAIGDRAGYSRGLVTARFGNKDGLIDALIDRIVTRWSDAGPHPEGTTGMEALATLLRANLDRMERDPAGLRVLLALMFEAGTNQKLRSRFAGLHESMRADYEAALRRGKRDGSIDPRADPRLEGALIVGGLRGIAYQWQLDPDDFDSVDAVRYLIDTTTERLSP